VNRVPTSATYRTIAFVVWLLASLATKP